MKVVVADDAVLLREGIVKLLESEGFDVVGQCGTANDLLLKVRSYKPEVAIVDIRMPPTHSDEGLRAAQEIREKHPETAVLVLSQYVEPEYAMELLAESAEGVGYLLKDRVSDVREFALPHLQTPAAPNGMAALGCDSRRTTICRPRRRHD